jgi:hypothetical protein
MIQNLVNRVEFDGSKEAYMVSLNPFLCEANQAKLQKFLRNITTKPKQSELSDSWDSCDSNSDSVVPHHIAKAYQTIITFLLDNFELLWKNFVKQPELAKLFLPFIRAGLGALQS